MEAKLQRITPFLWFDDQAEQAVKHYISLFEDAKIRKTHYYDEQSAKTAGMPKGSVMAVEFQLEGQQFVAMNGGPDLSLNKTVSFTVMCGSQEDVDYYWERLAEIADEQQTESGWLKDKFGVSWQIIPSWLIKLTEDPEQDKKQRYVSALLQMKKLGKARRAA